MPPARVGSALRANCLPSGCAASCTAVAKTSIFFATVSASAHDLRSPTNKIAVSDRGTLRGLTQFLRCSVSACPQTVECKSHRGTGRIEGGFCATLFQTVRKSLILNGEMSEWLNEHAWKA